VTGTLGRAQITLSAMASPAPTASVYRTYGIDD
jgi:hypothetical protein